MDGTLVSSNHKISEADARAVKKAQEKGIEFIITTGRSYEDAVPQVQQAGIECSYLVMNGSELRNANGKIIQSLYLSVKSGKAGKYDTNGVKVYVPSGDDDDKPDITPAPTFTEEQFAAEIFRLTNVERTKYGKPLVQTNDDLNRAAMQRAKEISVKFSHTRPDGTDSTSILSEYGIPDDNGGENIAAGFTSPQSTIDGWMNSPGHRVALLNTYSTHLGVGVYKSGSTYYCVQVFTAYGEKEKLTIDANGGYFPTLNNVSVYDMYFYHGTKIKFSRDIPTPVREGYTFVGWSRYGRTMTNLRLTCDEEISAIWSKN